MIEMARPYERSSNTKSSGCVREMIEMARPGGFEPPTY